MIIMVLERALTCALPYLDKSSLDLRRSLRKTTEIVIPYLHADSTLGFNL